MSNQNLDSQVLRQGGHVHQHQTNKTLSEQGRGTGPSGYICIYNPLVGIHNIHDEVQAIRTKYSA